MEQRKRPGGNSGSGYYTSWEKKKKNGCIYCGNPAETREHIPSKTLLVEPYPENLPTIPACFICNNGFSADELYVSCFLDTLKCSIFSNYDLTTETVTRLEKTPTLSKRLQEDIQTINGEVSFSYDKEKLLRILVKLAQGHVGFEFDHLSFDNDSLKVWYDFVFNLSESDILEFNKIPEDDKAPEVGSRGMVTPFIVQNIETGEASVFMFWHDVQDEQYRYQIYYNENNELEVKIVILEMLYFLAVFN